MWVNVIYIRDGLVKSFQVSASLVNHYFFNLINGSCKSCTLHNPAMLELAGPNALYSFLLGGPKFWFQHLRFLGCRKLSGSNHFRGSCDGSREAPQGESLQRFLSKEFIQKKCWDQNHRETFWLLCSLLSGIFSLPSLLPLPPLCHSFSPAASLPVFLSFPLSLSTYCHCHLVQCDCASLLPCVVTQDRLFTSRGVRRMWVCFTLLLDFNQD